MRLAPAKIIVAVVEDKGAVVVVAAVAAAVEEDGTDPFQTGQHLSSCCNLAF